MKKLISLSFLIFISACATATKSLRSEEFSHLFEYKSGLIVPAEVVGSTDPSQTCRMEFSSTQGKRQVLVFQPGKDLYFTPLDPGTYQVTQLNCGRGVYPIEHQPPWARIVITDGALSYFSLLRFNLSNPDVMVQHPSRDQSLEAFKNTWKTLSVSDRNRLVLALDGRKLTEGMQDIEKVVVFHFSTPREPVDSNTLKEPVMDCYKKEVIQNHTLLGKAEYQLTYQKNKLEKMQAGPRSTHTFTPQFIECVEKAFTDYKPDQAVSLKVTL